MTLVILLGAPGAGKSTVGALLAKNLKLAFVDTDRVIEEISGKSVSQIFVDDGEDRFRALELEVLENQISARDTVLALGGGAPISPSAQALLKNSKSIKIFLDVSLSVAAPRVGFNRDRPLLLGNPRAQWQSLLDKRRPIYEDVADHCIKVDALKAKAIVSRIVEMIK
jgi:shikimate kinase